MSQIGPGFGHPPQRQVGAAGVPKSAQPGPVSPGASGTGASPGTPGEGIAPWQLAMTLSPLFAAQTALGPEQLGLFLRNMLQLPRDVRDLLAMLAETDGPAAPMNAQTLGELLARNPEVSLTRLQAMLQGANLEEKLLKLLQSTRPDGAFDTAQTGELLRQATQLLTQAASSPVHALQTTIALYLPWYPLTPPMRIEVQLPGPEESARGAGAEAPQLVLLIETLTLGRMKAVLSVAQPTRLQVSIQHDPFAEKALQAVQADFSARLMRDGAQQPLFVLEPHEPASPHTRLETALADETDATTLANNPPEPSPQTPRQAIGVQPAGGVSALVVHAAYLLARLILTQDNRNAVIT